MGPIDILILVVAVLAVGAVIWLVVRPSKALPPGPARRELERPKPDEIPTVDETGKPAEAEAPPLVVEPLAPEPEPEPTEPEPEIPAPEMPAQFKGNANGLTPRGDLCAGRR
jgi:hypothetical protein